MMATSDSIAQQEEEVTDATRTGRRGRPQDTLCVLVVGKAGHTDALRADPGAAVTRVDSLLEAIAFISAGARAPHPTYVAALSAPVWTLPSLKEFTEALHFVDSSACVVHIGPCEPAARELIHGVVSHQMHPEEIRAIVESRHAGPLPAPIEVFAPEDAAAPAPNEVGDYPLLRAVKLGD
jgi:hypothetical protein